MACLFILSLQIISALWVVFPNLNVPLSPSAYCFCDIDKCSPTLWGPPRVRPWWVLFIYCLLGSWFILVVASSLSMSAPGLIGSLFWFMENSWEYLTNGDMMPLFIIWLNCWGGYEDKGETGSSVVYEVPPYFEFWVSKSWLKTLLPTDILGKSEFRFEYSFWSRL